MAARLSKLHIVKEHRDICFSLIQSTCSVVHFSVASPTARLFSSFYTMACLKKISAGFAQTHLCQPAGPQLEGCARASRQPAPALVTVSLRTAGHAGSCFAWLRRSGCGLPQACRAGGGSRQVLAGCGDTRVTGARDVGASAALLARGGLHATQQGLRTRPQLPSKQQRHNGRHLAMQLLECALDGCAITRRRRDVHSCTSKQQRHMRRRQRPSCPGSAAAPY